MSTTQQQAREIREAITAFRKMAGQGTKIPQDLRNRVIQYHQSRWELGVPRKQIARELCMSYETLRKWTYQDQSKAQTAATADLGACASNLREFAVVMKPIPTSAEVPHHFEVWHFCEKMQRTVKYAALVPRTPVAIRLDSDGRAVGTVQCQHCGITIPDPIGSAK